MISIEASVTGMGEDAKVVFWVDTAQIIQVTEIPYEFTWNTGEWDTATYIIRADAIEGNTLPGSVADLL